MQLFKGTIHNESIYMYCELSPIKRLLLDFPQISCRTASNFFAEHKVISGSDRGYSHVGNAPSYLQNLDRRSFVIFFNGISDSTQRSLLYLASTDVVTLLRVC